ncbi:hypothetical protein QL285_046466 [Trifolium repens]|nr:hypothetical protein QL285_046466 [Trifolium repens]
MQDLKLIGLKSHDCHVLMQQLLPVAIRAILPDNVRKTITRLCLFFNAICCKAIDPLKLDELENEAAVILCQLEMYIHHLCIENNISEVYGLLDPVVCNIIVDGKASNQKISQGRCKQYIQKKLQNEKKECLLIPFNHGGHWQLIILCPNTNTVVVLCSLHRALNPTKKNIVSSAFTVHQMANGNRKNNTQWLYPKMKKQPNSIDCGYYVMKNMLDIVSANITGSCMEVFHDPTELSSDELYELRKIWATYFLELYKGVRVSSRCKFNNGLEFHLAI